MTAKHFEQSGFTRTVVPIRPVTFPAGKVNDSGCKSGARAHERRYYAVQKWYRNDSVFLHNSQLVKWARKSVPQKRIRNGRLRLQRPDVLRPRSSLSVKAAGDVFTIEQVVNMQRTLEPAMPTRAKS